MFLFLACLQKQASKIVIRGSMFTRAEFHKRSTYNFHPPGAQKLKKDSQVVSLFTLLGSTSIKAERKYVGEIESRSKEK